MPFRPFPGAHLSPSRRAALLSRAALDYKELVDSRTLKPDPQPYDQLPHTRIFNACRVPEAVCDVQARYQPNDSIVCICRNEFWVLDQTRFASVASLEATFSAVVTAAGQRSSVGPGVLTYLHRDKWAAGHKHLIALGNNRETLETIQRSAFVVCLDDGTPRNVDELFNLTLMGDAECCANRWFDKPLQFIVYRNGEAGLNGEHSPVDGEPVARIMDYVLDAEPNLHRDAAASAAAGAPVAVRKLRWQLDESMQQLMAEASRFAVAQIANLKTKQLVFEGYGKDVIRSFKVSPDAWAQAAIQLSYFRLHGVFAPTYESASTRQYLAGRTETGS